MQARRGFRFCPRCGQEYQQQVDRGRFCSTCEEEINILRRLPGTRPLQPAYYRVFPGKNS